MNRHDSYSNGGSPVTWQSERIEVAGADMRLLEKLASDAADLAPRLGEEYLRRVIEQFKDVDLRPFETSRRNLETWFVGLFHRNDQTTPEEDSFADDSMPPVQQAFCLMDLILDYGDEVASRWPESYQARRAFHKRLGQALAGLREREWRHTNFLAEMMLLD